MRSVILFALAVLAIASVVPRLYMDASRANQNGGAGASSHAQEQTYRTLTLFRSGAGHFEADASVNGRRMRFLVDTGASVVVLRESEAARLGIHPIARDYRAKVSTANGVVMAAPVELNRVDIGSLTVQNVAALVLPDDALAQNLLGMSFLSRVRFEHKNGRLVLEQ
jgi:aspartyl protease family protein